MSEHLFDKVFSVNLTEWARRQGIHPQTAYRWFRNGTLPVPAVRVNARSEPGRKGPAQGGGGAGVMMLK
jgi:putative resolvase